MSQESKFLYTPQAISNQPGSIPGVEDARNFAAFHDAIPAICDYAFSNPEWVAKRFPPYLRDYISSMPLAEVETYLPGFSEGKYFYQSYKQNPQAWVPSEQMINRIKFAGEKDMEALYSRVTRKVHDLANKFPYPPGVRRYLNSTVTDQRLNYRNVIEALGIVERFMEKAKVRRTGEEAFTHILRVLDRGVDFIDFLNNLSSSLYPPFFTPEIAELFLLTCVLHDFTEDKNEQLGPDGKTIRRGRVLPVDDSLYPDREGVLLSIIEYHGEEETSKDGKKRQIINGPIHTEEEVFLPIKPTYTNYLTQTVKALNSENFPENMFMEGISEMTEKQDKSVTIYSRSQMLLRYMGFLAKILDRKDNLDAYPFVFENGIYQPQTPQKIFDKAIETVTKFPTAEDHLRFVGDGFYIRPFSVEKMHIESLKWLLGEITFTPKEIRQMLPTRHAFWMLAGVPPDLMYQNDSKDPKAKKRFPVVI